MRTARSILLPALISLSASANGQNWALLNPAYKYNYANDGTDTISNQIFVTRIDTLGVDSFRYELNGVAELCDTCAGPALYLWTNSPQFLQRSVNVGSGVWHFHDPGSFVILPQALTGEPWLFDTLATVQAMITSIDTVDQFGSSVARKVIALSDGGQLTISETYGILAWNNRELIGVQGPQMGRLIPSIEQFFPFGPGDILQYAWGHVGCHPCIGEDGIFRNTIVSTDISAASVLFTCDRVAYTHHYETDWNFNTSHWYTYDNGPSIWEAGRTELPFFDLIHSYPGQFIAPRTTEITYGSQWGCIAQHELTTDGRYRISCDTLSWAEGPSHFLDIWSTNTSDLVECQPRNYNTMPDQESGAVYEEGSGLTLYRSVYFDGFEYYVQDASVIAGDTSGTLLTQDQLLTIRDQQPFPSVTLHPDPADHTLTVDTSSPLPISWLVLSISGQPMLSGLADRMNSRTIDVSILPIGSYLMELHTEQRTLHQHFIIVR
jgi:hypothetical protein